MARIMELTGVYGRLCPIMYLYRRVNIADMGLSLLSMVLGSFSGEIESTHVHPCCTTHTYSHDRVDASCQLHS